MGEERVGWLVRMEVPEKEHVLFGKWILLLAREIFGSAKVRFYMETPQKTVFFMRYLRNIRKIPHGHLERFAQQICSNYLIFHERYSLRISRLPIFLPMNFSLAKRSTIPKLERAWDKRQREKAFG